MLIHNCDYQDANGLGDFAAVFDYHFLTLIMFNSYSR